MTRRPKKTITEVTRRDIIDWIATSGTSWAGTLDEDAFLNRLYDLQALPSHDRRYSTAAADIHQHRVNNWDGDDNWVFDDVRFDLRHGPDEAFAAFLAMMVHPAVRQNESNAREVVDKLNGFLARDGWQLVEIDEMSGRPLYEARQNAGLKTGSTALDLDRYRRLQEPDAVREHLRRIERALGDDPAAAIGSSKELVETTCKLVLDDFGESYGRRDDLIALYKKTAEVLGLRAEDIPDNKRGSEAAQKTLRSLVPVVQNLAELRNELGLGHGRTSRSAARPRHARLAFNAATTIVEFLLDTWQVRRQQSDVA